VIFVLLAVCLLCLAAGLLLLWRSRAGQARTGLPPGEIIYADTGDWMACERPLFSNRHRLTGRPDYLVRAEGHIVPVEVKSTKGLQSPYESHLLQLMAYCLLVEETERHAPSHGLVNYPDRTFRIPYTLEARSRLIELLAEIRAGLQADDVPRSHCDPRRCQYCGFRSYCTQSL